MQLWRCQPRAAVVRCLRGTSVVSPLHWLGRNRANTRPSPRACVSARGPLLALLGSTKTRGLRVDAAHVDVALRSPSKTTPSASCSGRGAPSRRGRRAGVNARTTGNLLTQGSQAPGQTALRRNTRMQFRKLGCLAHLRSMRVAFRSCSYPRSTKVLITAFGPFGLTWPREPCNG